MGRRISIFGVTGSIGQSACKVLTQRDDVRVDTISGHKNVVQMAKCVAQLNPELVVMGDAQSAQELRSICPNYGGKIEYGRDALYAGAQRRVDISLQAVVGFEGVELSLIAAKYAKRLALANKEALVCAGTILNAICASFQTELIPVDSEHSALFQCLGAHPLRQMRRMILTASGGPFRKATLEQMQKASIEQALEHPTWAMGARITIDSATMFNKAMELIEAQQLFQLAPEQLEVVVHPECIIHGVVEFDDYSTLAQLSVPNMIGPIAYALDYPNRYPLDLEPLDLVRLGQLNFEAVDATRFPAIDMARHIMAQGGLSGACFNAAKEVALDRFFAKEIGFFDMNHVVSGTLDALNAHCNALGDDIDAVVEMNTLARRTAMAIKPA